MTTLEISAIFSKAKYIWHSYTHAKPTKIISGKREITLRKGHKFGIRAATSKKGMARLITEHEGPTKVYSLPLDDTVGLMQRAKRIKTSEVKL